MGVVIQGVVMVINIVFKISLLWHTGNIQIMMFDLKNWCDLPNVMGVINGTRRSILANLM
jgi:hypothetical protein